MLHSLLVVVPTLNSYSLLPKLLESIQAQSWSDWRVLFVDGPSGACHREWLEKCCANHTRCSWVEQDPNHPGIFGAMDLGFALASPSDWLLFWGSDDWAATPYVFNKAFRSIEFSDCNPDLVVCKGRYVHLSSDTLGRFSQFCPASVLDCSAYRRALWLGATPPHQATFFGPGARNKLNHYTPGFRLSADLDYFLKLSRCSDLRVQCLDLELVHMAEGGVSGQYTKRRLLEVCRAYRCAYGWQWWFPFLARYFRRLFSLTPAFE